MISDADLMQELRTEAIDAAEDRLANMNEVLVQFRDGMVKSEDTLATIRLDTHSLKAVAASFDMTALKAMCHRFEDYLFNIKAVDGRIQGDMQVFVDRMSECLDAFVKRETVDISSLVRQLPMKGGFDVGDITVTDIEVMLVMQPGTATKIVTRELIECGYRIVNVASMLDAFHLVPSMRPDMVIISRVMPELSGIDLACALKAMPTTRDIPVALIATVDHKDEHLKDLPKTVPILRKGSKFADSVADVFVELGIL